MRRLQALLTACGDSDSSPAVVTPAASTKITGTAAAGAPIIGTVTVKDSLGAQKTVGIQTNGAYSVDDINKTVNITPFTDLIVANMAGLAAKTYFAAPAFSVLTTAELNAARQTLTNRLLTILNAMGVSASFDLLRSSFAADHSGFDGVMDVVRVSTDPATQSATITDLVNLTQIQDDLASKTDSTTLPAPATSLSDTVTSLKSINQTLANFSAVFVTLLDANGAPIGTPATATLAGKPSSTSEATAASDAWFPRLVSTDPATKAGLIDGKHITFTLTPSTNASYTFWTAA